MGAMIIFIRERIRDASAFETYGKKAGPTLAGHPGTPRAFYGACETLEGAPVEGVVVIEFPDMAAARAWYDSPAYVEARQHRHLGSDYRVFITETL